LRTALFRAGQTKQPVRTGSQKIEVAGKSETVAIEVRPMDQSEQEQGFFLVLFHRQAEASEIAQASSAGPPAETREAEAEIDLLKQQLSTTVEQYEAANEELKASNEELQAMNEEMRTAAEELETSKEELQSINEELSTVNHELKSSVEDLSRANSDLQNLMSSTGIPTLFLDRGLHIKRFTPPVQDLFNVIAADVGRPLSDITAKLRYPDLPQDAERVIRDLEKIEREVRSDGQYFLARLSPYRTSEEKIDGVVVSFVEITQLKEAEEELRANMEELRRFNQVAVGRESRMIELKKQINELCSRIGEPARYSLAFEREEVNT
jgi:two-component system, chemotaxis family, CheB/CheR fusion protein